MIGGQESLSRMDQSQDSTPERRGARRIVSPFRCRIWTQHSRPEEQLTDDACKSLRESITKNGQHQATLGRPVRDDPDCDVEIICGARRLSVARALGRDLLVEIRYMTDAESYVAMYEENLLREADSPYVRGQILARALRSGTYTSQQDLGRAFNLAHSGVSRLLMLAQLPSVVVAAFPSPDDIREAWGVALFRLWSDARKRDTLADRARAIMDGAARLSPREIYEALIRTSRGQTRDRRLHRNVPIRGASNVVLFHEQDQLDRVMYIIPKTFLDPKRREALKRCIVQFLECDSRRLASGHHENMAGEIGDALQTTCPRSSETY